MGFFSKLMGGSHSEKELKELRAKAEAIYKRGESLKGSCVRKESHWMTFSLKHLP